ncbi:MAG TPA: hypothetical protein VIV11_34205 [Kofleriaceae bacterium]
MKRAALLLVLVPSIAHAEERTTAVTLAGMFGVMERPVRFEPGDPEYWTQPEAIAGPRLTLSWEHAPLELPPTRGYRFAGAIVPELVAGAFIDDHRAQGFVGAGLRAELKMSQREMGLLKVSARGAAYVAARGMVVGEERKGFFELAIGDYFVIGRTGRIGFEGGLLLAPREDQMDYDHDRSVGGVMQIYVGWQH